MPADRAELEDWLALSLTDGVGPATLRKLLAHFGAPDAARAARRSELVTVVGEPIAAALAAGPDLRRVEAAVRWAEEPGHTILTLADEEYPPRLLECADPPALLHVVGDVAALRKPMLAIVGSRSASPQGARNAEAFAQALSAAGYCIVSGLALGIDAAAHRGGLAHRAGSVAVLGTGADRIYPESHRHLAERVVANGALLSEFALGTPPLPANFPRRNRIIATLASGCLVVEAAVQSGSLITARLAAEYGRDVFAIPGSIHSPLAKGCHALIRQGAKLVESARDILDELGAPVRKANATEMSAARVDALSPDASAIAKAMGEDCITLDRICALSRLDAERALAALLELELAGAIARMAGGRYQKLN